MTDTTGRLNLIVTDVRNPDFARLPSTVIEVMIQEARDKQSRLRVNIENLGKKQSDAKKHGNLRKMKVIGHDILSLQYKLNKLKDQLPVLEEALHSRRLDENILSRLGSERNVIVVDHTILFFTIITLLLVGLEMFFKLSQETRHILDIVDTLICIVFLYEFFWRMQFSDSGWWYFKRNWILFIASLPLVLLLHLPGILPFAGILQFGQGVRLVRIIRGLRLIRGITYFSRGMDRMGVGTQMLKQPFLQGLLSVFLGRILTGLQVKKIIRPLLFTLLTIFIGGILISYFDGSYDRNVHGLSQGTWWCFTTVITKDFANIYNPQHLPGRIITTLIVLIGMLLSGALIGNLTDTLMEDSTNRIERKQAILQRRLDQITEKLKTIEKLLNEIEEG